MKRLVRMGVIAALMVSVMTVPVSMSGIGSSAAGAAARCNASGASGTVLEMVSVQAYACQFASSANPAYFHYGEDSANFVSQLLSVGGLLPSTGAWNAQNTWWSDPPNGTTAPPSHSLSWTSPGALYTYLIKSGNATALSASQATLANTQAGDLIFWNWYPVGGSTGSSQHLSDVGMIISGNGSDPSTEMYASHTPTAPNPPNPPDSPTFTTPSQPQIPGLVSMSTLLNSDVGAYLSALTNFNVVKYNTTSQCPSSDPGTNTANGLQGVCWSWSIVRLSSLGGNAGSNAPQPITPQGSAVTRTEVAGGGSLDQACGCGTKSAASEVDAADPVNTATGDFHETTTDLSVPGAGVPLQLTRTYSSTIAQTQAAAGQPGSLGYGWSYNFGMAVSYNTSSQVATVTDENGAQSTFVPYVSGTSPGWCSGATNFCATAPRTLATLNQSSTGWTLVRDVQSPMTYTFVNNSTGTGASLGGIQDAQGDQLNASVGTPGAGKCPSSASSCTVWTSTASQRAITLAFNSSGQLVSATDPGGNQVTYCYFGSSCASGSGGGSSDLASATLPGNLTTTYSYDAGNSNANLVHDLLDLTPPGASSGSVGEVVNQYNSSGQISQQTEADGAVVTFTYSGNNFTISGGTTTVSTYPQGLGNASSTNVYVYDNGTLTSEEVGAGSSTAATEYFNRDAVSLLPDTSVDLDGNVTQNTLQTYNSAGGTPTSSGNIVSTTDGDGNTSQFAYTSGNLVWCEVDAAETADNISCPATPPASPPAPGASDPQLGATIFYYNAANELVAETDALGNTTEYAYTSTGEGVPSGLQYCTVDPVDYQKGVTCPAYGAVHVDGTSTETFDSAGDVLTSTDPDGDVTTNVYDVAGHPGLVSASTDPDGTTTTYTYNSAGQVTRQVVSFGTYIATTLYAYDTEGRKYCEVDPYEAVKGVTCPTSPPSSSSPPANTISTFYNSANEVVQTTNAIGGTTIYAYDGQGNNFCTVTPVDYASGVRCPSSPPSSAPTPGNDPYLGATIDTYNALNQQVQETNPLGGITTTSYDPQGNVHETVVESGSTGAPNVTTLYTYNGNNQVATTTVDPGSSVAATTIDAYDPNGNLYCEVSANASAGMAAGTSSYQCPTWSAGWIVTPPSPSALYSSTPTSSQAHDVSTTFYDDNGDLVQSSNADGETTVTAYDGDGRTYCTSDPTNVASWLTAHSGGPYPYLCPSPSSSVPAPGSNPGYVFTTFDDAGRTVTSTDQVGDTTRTAYDPAGNTQTTTDPRGNVTTSCYYWQNAAGQCAHSAPAGGGSGDDLYSQTTPPSTAEPSGETTTYTYYPGDMRDIETTPAGETQDTYDGLGDLTAVTYPTTASGYSTPPNVATTYSPDGSKKTMTDGTGTTTYISDAMGDVTTQQFVAASGSGLANQTIGYSYYSTGVEKSVVYPNYQGVTNPTATYTYDGLGNMASVTDWSGNEVSFAHDPDGNLTSQDNEVSSSNPSGTSNTVFSYDSADQMTQATSTALCSGTNGTLTQSFAGANGSRNPDGLVTQDQEQYGGSCSGPASYQQDYSYDDASRLVYQGNSPQGTAVNNLAYDGAGDPTEISAEVVGGGSDTFSQSFNAADQDTGQTPISGSGGTSATYGYDSLGDRTTEVSGSTTSTMSYNQAGQLTSSDSQPGVTTTAVAGGSGFTLALESNGTVWSSGDNYEDALGNGSSGESVGNDASTPQEVVGLTGVTAIAAQMDTGMALESNGTVWTWGWDSSGQLGNGGSSFSAASMSPVPVEVQTSTGPLTGVVAIAGGGQQGMALTSSGNVYTWGLGMYGQLGNDTTNNSSIALEVPNLSSVTSIAAQIDSDMALLSNGTVVDWGWNGQGELGDGNTSTESTVPVPVSGVSGATAIGASDWNGMALSGGLVYTWGYNLYGNLGDGNTTNSDVAVEVNGLSGATAVAGDGVSDMALLSNGTVEDWGANYYGNLGNDTTNASDVPIGVMGLTGVTSIEQTEDENGIALTSNGTVYGWGYNYWGELGTASALYPEEPIVSGLSSLSGSATDYEYNGDGLEISSTQTSSGTSNQLTWDTNSSLPTVIADSNYDSIYGPTGEPVEEIGTTALVSFAGPLFMTYNPSDSAWVVNTSSGNLSEFYRYDSFGNLALGAQVTAFGFAGQYTGTTESPANTLGDDNMQARWYDPQSGEFTSVDPDLAETNQPYQYAGDDPVNESDPSGLITCGGWLGWVPGCGTVTDVQNGISGAAKTTWNGVKSFGEGLVASPHYCGTNGAAYDAGNVTWWAAAIGGLFGSAASNGDENENDTGAGEAAGGASEEVIPLGFASASEFNEFGSQLYSGLTKAGFGNTQAVLQGSAVTGQSFSTGAAFGANSDFDVALGGDEIFGAAVDDGFALRSGGIRTGPLSAIDVQTLGLSGVRSSLSAFAGRPVNFMIFRSIEDAVERGPSITIPAQQ
jgi:RHS repeat-associated protein